MKIIYLIIITIGIHQYCFGQKTNKGWSASSSQDSSMDKVNMLVETYDDTIRILYDQITKMREQLKDVDAKLQKNSDLQDQRTEALNSTVTEMQKETNMLKASVQTLEIWQKNFGEGIRLVHVQGMPSSDRYGRLEVFHCLSGTCEWGTVCDDSFTETNANVACRQLGTHSALENENTNSRFPGTGKIWLDDVWCTGSESSLYECRHRRWGVHNCGHHEDVRLGCN